MALNPLVSLIGRLVARSGRNRGNRQTDRQTDRQNDKTTTVTLAAHARRGLITSEWLSIVGRTRVLCMRSMPMMYMYIHSGIYQSGQCGHYPWWGSAPILPSNVYIIMYIHSQLHNFSLV